jgi:predicted chitinase
MFLPKPSTKTRLTNFLKKFWENKQRRYAIASVLDIILILVILIYGVKPAQRIITPLIEPVVSKLQQKELASETFAFAPGLSSNKLKKIDFEGLNYLSYFDVAVKKDGSLNKEHKTFKAFTSEDSAEVFETARFNNTKVLLTLTQTTKKDIQQILDSIEAQQTLINESIEAVKEAGINGITLDFEVLGSIDKNYQAKYSALVSRFTSRMHQEIPGSQVAVVISNKKGSSSLYDNSSLERAADKVLVMTDNIPVIESKNATAKSPLYGYGADDFWKDLSSTFNNFFNISSDKLVMERAWYGDGDRYPLYVPKSTPSPEEEKEPAHVFLDNDTVERLVSGVPRKSREAARKNIPLIGKALDEEGILDSNVLAYALATIEHETAGTFEPIDEYSGRLSARRLGYEGGTNYFGRGFIQLTHLRNYKVMGERIGMGDSLAKNPELASTPEVAAQILAAFFKDNNIANLASKGRFVAARVPVNPDRNGWAIAELAWKYEEYGQN